MGSVEADQIIGLYERHARAWDSDRGRDLSIEKDWVDRFIELLPPGAAILDVGCGSGQPLSSYLIEQGFQLCGIDSSPTMISLCRDRFREGEWLVANMRTLALNRKFPGLLAWDSLFHLPHKDQRRMFSVFQAHAAADTALLFTSGPVHGEAIGSYRGERLYHASLSPAEYQELLTLHGFTMVAHQSEDPFCGGHTVWLAVSMGC